jgi:hypothetical protein
MDMECTPCDRTPRATALRSIGRRPGVGVREGGRAGGRVRRDSDVCSRPSLIALRFRDRPSSTAIRAGSSTATSSPRTSSLPIKGSWTRVSHSAWFYPEYHGIPPGTASHTARHVTSATGGRLKLIDFGFSCTIKPGDILKESLGTGAPFRDSPTSAPRLAAHVCAATRRPHHICASTRRPHLRRDSVRRILSQH